MGQCSGMTPDWLGSTINGVELRASGGKLRITDAVSGRLLLFAVGPEDYRFGERRVIGPGDYPLAGLGSVPTEIVSDESMGITGDTQVFVIDLDGDSFVIAGSAGLLVNEDQ